MPVSEMYPYHVGQKVYCVCDMYLNMGEFGYCVIDERRVINADASRVCATRDDGMMVLFYPRDKVFTHRSDAERCKAQREKMLAGTSYPTETRHAD